MGDINFKPDSKKIFVVINNKTYLGTLCAKALEELEQRNAKLNSKRK